MSDTPSFPLGQTFALLLNLAEETPLFLLEEWTHRAQLRQYRNNSPSGLLAELEVFYRPDSNTFLIYSDADTSDWPYGLAELDLQFNHPVSGQRVYTHKRTLKLERTVTRND